MMVAGCDVGSLATKAVIMRDGRIIGTAIVKSKARPAQAAEAAMKEALSRAGAAMADLSCIVATGYGRGTIAFAHEAVTEISCHARGARWLLPTAMTVIDIGGQDCKAIRLEPDGKVAKFAANDKCASGTGRFLEVMAKVLGVGPEDLGSLSSRANNPVTLASACTVWAQADVIAYLHNKVPPEDIAAGVNNAMAARTAVLAHGVGIAPDVCMTGGVAKNDGVVRSLEALLGVRIKRIRRLDPQLAGAIGAALYASDRAAGRTT